MSAGFFVRTACVSGLVIVSPNAIFNQRKTSPLTQAVLTNRAEIASIAEKSRQFTKISVKRQKIASINEKIHQFGFFSVKRQKNPSIWRNSHQAAKIPIFPQISPSSDKFHHQSANFAPFPRQSAFFNKNSNQALKIPLILSRLWQIARTFLLFFSFL
jgi:hypothetical protein